MAGRAATPVPLRAMVCGEPVTLSPTVIEAESEPAVVGLNVTAIVQVALTARLLVQVVVSVKLPEFVPVTLMEVRLRLALPVFFTVTVCAALATPTVVLAKLSEAGLKEIAGTPTPVPERATVCGEPEPLSATLTEAVRDPVAVGLKATLIVQLLPTATVVPQLLVWLKSPGLPPVSETVTPVNGAVPELVSFTLCAAVVVPIFELPNASETGLKVTPGAPTVTVTAEDELESKEVSPE